MFLFLYFFFLCRLDLMNFVYERRHRVWGWKAVEVLLYISEKHTQHWLNQESRMDLSFGKKKTMMAQSCRLTQIGTRTKRNNEILLVEKINKTILQEIAAVNKKKIFKYRIKIFFFFLQNSTKIPTTLLIDLVFILVLHNLKTF